MKVFPEEISFQISRLSKDHLHSYTQASSNALKTWIEQKGGGRANLFFLLELGHLSRLVLAITIFNSQAFWHKSVFMPQPPDEQVFGIRLIILASLVLRSLSSNWMTPPAFLFLQLADGRLWELLASRITWANSYNKYPHIFSYFNILMYSHFPMLLFFYFSCHRLIFLMGYFFLILLP